MPVAVVQKSVVAVLTAGALCLPAAAFGALAKEKSAWGPRPVVGTKMIYTHSDGTPTTHLIEKIEGDNVWNTVNFDNGGAPATNRNVTYRSIVTWELHRVGEGVIRWDFDRNQLARLWPLKVGNAVRLTARVLLGKGKTREAALAALKQTHSVTYRFVVEGRRHVTVPAGTFQSWVILRIAEQRDLEGKLTFVAMRRYWLAEDLGWIVRLDSDTIYQDAKANRVASLTAKAVALPSK